jgi:hypothetical protein
MKITYKIVTPIGSLEHSFKDEMLVQGFQELEDMLGECADPLPRTVLLKNYMDKNGLWGKTYDNFFITNIERTEEGEFWLFTKTLN